MTILERLDELERALVQYNTLDDDGAHPIASDGYDFCDTMAENVPHVISSLRSLQEENVTLSGMVKRMARDMEDEQSEDELAAEVSRLTAERDTARKALEQSAVELAEAANVLQCSGYPSTASILRTASETARAASRALSSEAKDGE